MHNESIVRGFSVEYKRFDLQLDCIRDKGVSADIRMAAIKDIHATLNGIIVGGFQDIDTLRYVVNKLKDTAHNSIHDHAFLAYYCTHFPVSDFFFSRLLEIKDKPEGLNEYITIALLRNKELHDGIHVSRYLRVLSNEQDIPQIIEVLGWSIDQAQPGGRDTESLIQLIDNALSLKNADIEAYLHDRQDRLVGLYGQGTRRYGQNAFMCGIALLECGLVDIGTVITEKSHDSAPMFSLKRYEKASGTLITPELALARCYEMSSLISYFIERPDRIKDFSGKKLPLSEISLYRIQAMFKDQNTDLEKRVFIRIMLMIAKQWPGAKSDLGVILSFLQNAAPDELKKKVKGIFAAQAPRYFTSIPQLIALIGIFKDCGHKLTINTSIKPLRKELDKLLIGVPLEALREVLKVDPGQVLIDRDCIIDAIERNWDGWSDKEQMSLKSKAAPWIVDGVKQLKKMRIERDMGM